MKSIFSRLITLSRVLVLLTMGFAFSSCNSFNSNNNDQNQISNILYEIQSAYNIYDMDKIMSYVQSDYRHNNMLKWNLRELWEDRKAEYPLLSIDFVSANIVGDDALVSFRMTFDNSSETLVLEAPSPAGDIAYFHYNGDRWLICGNQQW